MNSKDIAPLKEFFADLALKAVKQIGDATFFDKVNNIKIVKAKGKSLKETQLISGVYVEKEKVDSGMPDIVKNAKIAVVRKKLDIKKTEFDAQIQIRNPSDIQKFLDQEEKILQNFVRIFKNLGVNIVVNNNDISDKIGAYLAKEGIAGIKNVGENDYKAILKATGANFIDDLKLMTENDLGFAAVVKFEKIGDNNYTFFEGCRDPKSVSIVLKGGLENILSTAEIALNDVLHVLAKTLDTLTIVAGGGAIYIELAKRLKDYANSISGKEQLAINAFALALEEIPRTLIRNAGLDEIEKITELRAAHKTDKDKWIGIDTITNTIGDNYKKGIIEPAELIIHIVKSAGELATLILRVDRIISSKGSKGGGMPRPS
jgi:chaperonin GroEL (HSP60 family)